MSNITPLVACPCCGYETIGDRGGFEFCKICWWEDDGQDNHDADYVRGGPNALMSLTQSRANYLLYGIYDSTRQDLINKRGSPEKYNQGRSFKIDSGTIYEELTTWSSSEFDAGASSDR